MPNRTVFDEREKFDHSGHPADRSVASDLRAPCGNEAQSEGGDRSARNAEPSERATPADPQDVVQSGRKHSRVRRLDSRDRSNQ